MSPRLIYWSEQMKTALAYAEHVGPYLAISPEDLVRYYAARAEWRKAGGAMNLYPKGGPVCKL
jgi:hypothetical protein